MDYAAKHAEILAKLRDDKGIAASFVLRTPGAYDETTDSYTDPTEVVVAGYAVEIPGDPEEYEALELIGTGALTIFFVPTVMGQQPDKDSSIFWAGSTRQIKQIFPVRPVGVFLAGRFIVS